MENATKHIEGDALRDLYERSGLSPSQFARLFGTHERAMVGALTGAGLQGEWKVEQYGRINQLIAEIESEGIRELTPLVAFNSPKLQELVRTRILSSSEGRSPFQRLLSHVAYPQQMHSSDLSVRDRLGVS